MRLIRSHWTLAIVSALVLLGSNCLPILAKHTYGRRQLQSASSEIASSLQQPDGPARFVAHLASVPGQEELDLILVALGQYLADPKHTQTAQEVFDLLIDRGDVTSAILAADVLLKTIESVNSSNFASTREIREFPDSLCNRAANLLEHDDPVVQVMAEWMLDLRIKRWNSTENRINRLFTPTEDSRKWHTAWKARGVRLADDYGRQLVNVNRHRTLAGLEEEIARISARMDALLAAQTSMDPGTALAQFQTALTSARQAAAGTDLVAGHLAYIKLRAAARHVVVAARPDFPTEGIAFFTSYEIPGGVWNVNVPVVCGSNKPGGELYVKRSANPAQGAQAVLKGQLSEGSIRGMDLEWSGERMVFSFWHQPPSTHAYGYNMDKNAFLYEIDLNTNAIRQLTESPGSNDVEPCYLPDGGFVFASDRSSFGNQCAGDFLQDKRCTTLYRLDADRADRPIAISNNKDFDRHPHVTNDGMIVFLHWEYQERHFYNLHTVWRCRPDGTNMDALYKQHINLPMSIRDVRAVPGSGLFVGTAQGHHDGHYGPVVVFDPTQGINNEKAMWNLTPGTSPVEGGIGPLERQIVPEGGVENRGGYYINPFPMSEKSFVVSLDMAGDKSEFNVYYVDVWGNRELLHRDPEMSCFQPQALRPRQRPPIVADTVDPGADHATVFVEDVHRDLPGVEGKPVKFLRVSQRLFLPAPIDPENYDFNHLHWLPGVSTAAHFSYWTWAPTRTVGIVHVNDRGSAYFKVPAGTPVFLQALDEDFTEVRRMRTSFTLQRGEFRGCVGCHESRPNAIPNAASYPSDVLARGPETPNPPSWGINTVQDYRQHAQPVLDKHCVRCHGSDKPKGGLDFTSREIGGFAQSYRTMFGLKPTDPTPIRELRYHMPLHPDKSQKYTDEKKANDICRRMQRNDWPGMLVSISDRHDNADITMPYQFGSARSKLVRTLLDDPIHRDRVKAEMTEDEWLQIVTWIDHNAVYHSTVIDKSGYDRRQQNGPLVRVPFLLPSPWEPADLCPSFLNEANLGQAER